MVVCLELMPLPLTVCCFSKIQIGFTFLVPAHPGGPRQRAVKWVSLCVCTAGLLLFLLLWHCWLGNSSGIRSLGSGFTPAWWNSRIEGPFNSYRARVFVIVGEFHVIKCCCSKDSLQLIHSAKRHRFSCSFPNKTTVCRASDDCLCDRSCST